MGNKYIQEVGNILSKKSRSLNMINEVNNDNINTAKEKKHVVNESTFQKIYDKKNK